MRTIHRWQFGVSLCAAALLAGLAWGASAPPAGPNCYVLSVGVDNYARAAKLKGCVNDATGIAAQFLRQKGKRFQHVTSHVLVDGQATRAAVAQKMTSLAGTARAGDFAVLFLSGHGGRTKDNSWFFLPQDYDGQRHDATSLSDRQILAWATPLVHRGLKVLVIIDACYSGQLRLGASAVLQHYREPTGGGLVLMLSSMPGQMSAALGKYSAFARAVVEGLAGEADLDGDGYVTLRELRLYAYRRTYELIGPKGAKAGQDGECEWSLSIREDLRLAAVWPSAGVNLAGTTWSGSEQLTGFGKLTFRFHANHRAIMQDTSGTSEGSWDQKGSQVTLRFAQGRVVYRGTLRGSTLAGTAGNGHGAWTWRVARQLSAPVPRPRDIAELKEPAEAPKW
jgi:hypothetical protein